MTTKFFIVALLSTVALCEADDIFRPDDYYDFFDENANSEHDEPQLDPLTRPPRCLAIALSDAMDIGPYQAGSLIGLLESGQ